MITGEGGFIHRSMPPVDWDCGGIPNECYNATLTKREIKNILVAQYTSEDNVKRLSNGDGDLLSAKWSLEILAEIDADTVWLYNMTQKDK